MIESLLALVIVAAAAAALAVRFSRLLGRKGRGCAGCSLARPGLN
ncbi:MAG TPA: hypothetical protein VFT32_08770 [Candidatus Eisenbacteria bacterium]|nr:hypothetical protein [Candidatus Eisenbacteria bacterium]